MVRSENAEIRQKNLHLLALVQVNGLGLCAHKWNAERLLSNALLHKQRQWIGQGNLLDEQADVRNNQPIVFIILSREMLKQEIVFIA